LAGGTAGSVAYALSLHDALPISLGAKRACAVVGLAAGTAYGFELVAYRGTLGQGAIFGALSNVVTGTTAASTSAVASVGVTPATDRKSTRLNSSHVETAYADFCL